MKACGATACDASTAKGQGCSGVGGTQDSAWAPLAHAYTGTTCTAAIMATGVGQQTKDSSSSL